MPVRAGNLPATFTTFVGRRREVAEVRRLLRTARLLTLTGMGGTGKTRLAIEAAAASARAFPDGVWLVDLAPVREPPAVAGTAAAALAVPDLGARPVIEQLGARLAGRRALLVLDNCEHLVDACAELARALLSAAAEVRILATSRQTLGIVGEHVYTVAPLPPEEAIELLRERTTAVRPEFRITEGNAAAVARLCADLDGLPLAIELAASRLRTLTAEQVVDRLEDRFKLLASGGPGTLPRQRTLVAAIEWSYDLCTPAERLLWNRLSVFDGSFCLPAAEDVCSAGGIAEHDVLDLLDRLVAQSVVLPVEAEGLLRYRLLETIRQYGRQRLAESGDQDRLRTRHRDYFLALAQRIADGWFGPGQQDGLARLRADHANLRKALDNDDDPQATLALTAALRFHWCVGGFLAEGRRQIERALAAAGEPTGARAQALRVAVWVAALQGDMAAAARWLDEAEALGEKLDDPVMYAYVQSYRGMSAAAQGRLEEAVSRHEAAVAAHTAVGERPGAVVSLLQLTLVRSRLSDPHAARSGRQAIALAEAHGELWGRSHALWALGCDAWARGDREACAALTRAALDAQRGFNDYVVSAMMLELLAWTVAAGGDHERAARLLGAARSLLASVGSTLAAGPYRAQDRALCEEAVLGALGSAAYEKALADGGRHDTPAKAIAYALDAGTDAGPASPAGSNTLTRREREVAALVAHGMTNRQIASTLGRSPRTVDMHVQNILAKLGFGSRAKIAAWWTAHEAPTP